MGRVSVKDNKNQYHIAREELGLSREKASELLETITPDRLERIENETSLPHADEVLLMAEKYKNLGCVTIIVLSSVPLAGSMFRRSKSKNCPPLYWRCLPR